MRPISMIIARVQAGLPITDEEDQAIREHIKECNKSQDRFCSVVFILCGAAFVFVLVSWFFKA